MSGGTWRAAADAVLEGLFKLGHPAPTRKQLIDAYPFGAREHWPYKVWLDAVKRWKAAWAKGLVSPDSVRPRRRESRDPAQLRAL